MDLDFSPRELTLAQAALAVTARPLESGGHVPVLKAALLDELRRRRLSAPKAKREDFLLLASKVAEHDHSALMPYLWAALQFGGRVVAGELTLMACEDVKDAARDLGPVSAHIFDAHGRQQMRRLLSELTPRTH